MLWRLRECSGYELKSRYICGRSRGGDDVVAFGSRDFAGYQEARRKGVGHRNLGSAI